MTLTSYFKKAALAGGLARGRSIRLGGKVYRIKGLFVNAIALGPSTLREDREPWLDSVFRSVLQCRAGSFLDVGANLGQTMFKVLALGPSRQYVGFEPQVACCFMIQRFLDDNRISNFRILPIGLSNADRLLELHGGSDDYSAAASLVDGFRPDSFYTSHRYVSVRKGDDVVDELGLRSICAIKVDVEGGELEVFEGLSNTLEKELPFLIFEVLNHFLKITQTKLDDQTIRFRESRIKKMESLLRQLGYEIYNVLPGNQLENVLTIRPTVSDDLSLTNYIAMPKSAVDGFLRIFSGNVAA